MKITTTTFTNGGHWSCWKCGAPVPDGCTHHCASGHCPRQWKVKGTLPVRLK